MKFGIIYTCYNMENYVTRSLYPFILARNKKLYNVDFYISVVSLPFAEYKDFEQKKDGTMEVLNKTLSAGNIDALINEPEFIPESKARSLAAAKALEAGCDYLWIVDGDEFYSFEQIENIIQFVLLDKFITWFRLSLKNYVFDENTYLEEPFTPARIWRVESNGYKFKEFNFDNDAVYNGTVVSFGKFLNKDVSDKELPSKLVPKEIAWVDHITWMNNENSRRKIEYQNKHFGGICSYAWDESLGGLIFNEGYYKKYNMSLPVTKKI